jgi:hypothetical protein
MIIFIQGIIILLVLMVCLVIARDIYNTKNTEQIKTERIGVLLGYVLVLLGSSVAIIKFM